MEVIDEIGASAKDEEPYPDNKIKLEGMLLPLRVSLDLTGAGYRCCVCCSVRVCHGSPEIEKSEDKDPNKVHEVPVKSENFDDLVMSPSLGEEAALFLIEIAAPDLPCDPKEENNS